MSVTGRAVAVAALALLAPTSAVALPAGIARSSGAVAIPTASPEALTAVNDQLIAPPWSSELATIQNQAAKSLAKLDGTKIGLVGGHRKHFKIDAYLVPDNLAPSLSLSNPPGFTSSSRDGFAFRAPLNGSWSLGLHGTVVAHVAATAAGQRLVSATTGPLPFSLTLSDFSLGGSVQVNSSDPAHPKLRSSSIGVHARIGGSLLFPSTSVDLSFARDADGILSAKISLTRVSLNVAGVGVDIQNALIIKLLPGVTTEAFGETEYYAYVFLGGVLAVHFPSPIHTISIPFDGKLFGVFPIPLPHKTADLVAFAGGSSIPNNWGGLPSPAPTPLSSPPSFSALRDTLESGIETHMPYGAVLSLLYEGQKTPKGTPFTYGLDADSTIWTGHYLAAESFRYASTHDPAALARVQDVIGGITRDFEETKDAVYQNGHYTPVPADQAGRIFARSVMPSNDPHGWHTTVADRATTDLSKNQCLYVKPSDGWKVGAKTYKTLAEVPQGKGKAFGFSTNNVTPQGVIWYGTGCGNREQDHGISRDQYSGIFMGLAYAWALVPDAQVHAEIRDLIDKALGYILEHQWAVPLPPDGTQNVRTTFLGDFDAQLAILRIGATIDPSAFGAAYDAAKRASALVWIPEWISTVDPETKYFKFNLDHAFLGPALFLETDPNVRSDLLAGYNVLRGATVTHLNAWFDLVDVLTGGWSTATPSAVNPSMKLDQEIVSDLADWQTRWALVKDSASMPTNTTPLSAAQYLAAQWPSGVGNYVSPTNRASVPLLKSPPRLFDRSGAGDDFIWQNQPFAPGFDPPGGKTKVVNGFSCDRTPPSALQIQACAADQPLQEGPGVDFLLPYWVAVYLGVLPHP